MTQGCGLIRGDQFGIDRALAFEPVGNLDIGAQQHGARRLPR
jgi:hypothetical protein